MGRIKHQIITYGICRDLTRKPSFFQQCMLGMYPDEFVEDVVANSHSSNLQVDPDSQSSLFFWHVENQYLVDTPKTVSNQFIHSFSLLFPGIRK
jgi:hypothetical protein